MDLSSRRRNVGPRRHVIGFMTAACALALCLSLPTSIQADERFTPVLAALMQVSPTFARQVARIQDEAQVAVRELPREEQSCCRARASIRRYDSGAIIAVIELPAMKTRLEYAELLGHEFEHILEQIDGVDIDAVGYRLAGLTRGDAAYETERAREAGRVVAGEARLRW
jgi:hypothetical protein